MKTLIVILVVFSAGCASFEKPITCPSCPPEPVIINSPYGPLRIDKGQMCPENYYTIPEWDKLVEDYYNSLPRSNM